MAIPALEQMLESVKVFTPCKEYETIDIYASGVDALYTPPIKIYDMPGTNMSLHIHGSLDGNYLYGGSIQELGTNNVLRKLNGYECCMFDNLYGNELGLPNLMNR